MENRTTIAVGSFEVHDGMIAVGDPCYAHLLSFEQFSAKNGKYNAYVVMSDEGRWGMRVAKLIAIHEDDDNGANTKKWEPCDFYLGVDSGTMGIFDNEYHYDHHYNEVLDDDWYERVVINMEGRFGIYDNSCIISESGFGDGSYDVDVIFDNDDGVTICAVAVIFIEEDDEDEYE